MGLLIGCLLEVGGWVDEFFVVRCLLFVVHYFFGKHYTPFHYIIEISFFSFFSLSLFSLFSLFSLSRKKKNKIKTNSKQQNKQLSTTTTIITTTCRPPPPPFFVLLPPYIYTQSHTHKLINFNYSL